MNLASLLAIHVYCEEFYCELIFGQKVYFWSNMTVWGSDRGQIYSYLFATLKGHLIGPEHVF